MPCGCGGNNTITKYRVTTGDGKNHDFLTIGEANTYRKTNGINAPARAVKVNKK